MHWSQWRREARPGAAEFVCNLHVLRRTLLAVLR